MLSGRSLIIFIGLFYVMESIPSGLIYQRLVKNGKRGREVVEIFYSGVEPPRCNNGVCKPMIDDAELTEYLKKSVTAAGFRVANTTTLLESTPITTKRIIAIDEQLTTTETIFKSQEEHDDEEEEEWDDDNIY